MGCARVADVEAVANEAVKQPAIRRGLRDGVLAWGQPGERLCGDAASRADAGDVHIVDLGVGAFKCVNGQLAIGNSYGDRCRLVLACCASLPDWGKRGDGLNVFYVKRVFFRVIGVVVDIGVTCRNSHLIGAVGNGDFPDAFYINPAEAAAVGCDVVALHMHERIQTLVALTCAAITTVAALATGQVKGCNAIGGGHPTVSQAVAPVTIRQAIVQFVACGLFAIHCVEVDVRTEVVRGAVRPRYQGEAVAVASARDSVVERRLGFGFGVQRDDECSRVLLRLVNRLEQHNFAAAAVCRQVDVAVKALRQIKRVSEARQAGDIFLAFNDVTVGTRR